MITMMGVKVGLSSSPSFEAHGGIVIFRMEL